MLFRVALVAKGVLVGEPRVAEVDPLLVVGGHAAVVLLDRGSGVVAGPVVPVETQRHAIDVGPVFGSVARVLLDALFVVTGASEARVVAVVAVEATAVVLAVLFLGGRDFGTITALAEGTFQ